MQLSQLITKLNLNPHPGEQWAALGPNAAMFHPLLSPATLHNTVKPNLDGILLVDILSSQADPSTWLEQIITTMKDQASLIVIDWQADGPLDVGPELQRRFKRGKLCRLLRETGFDRVETILNHNIYYAIRAVKGPISSQPQANTFIDVADLEELPRNAMKSVELLDHKIIIANTGREIVAFAQGCPHAEADLYQGRLRGRNVICPLHFYIWNVQTGYPVEPADEDILPRYPVKIDQERRRVLVSVKPYPASR